MHTASTPQTLEAPPSSTASKTPRRLHVAIVDEELPYPPTSGKRIRTLNLIQRLAHRHRITYICHRNADAEEARQAAGHMQSIGVTVRMTDWTPPPKSGPGFYARLAANLLSPLPYSVASHDSRPLRRALREHAAACPVDLWHCEWTPYVYALRGLTCGRRLVIAQNVESIIWRRYYETETNALRRWYIGRQWRKFERFERWVMGEVDRAVAVSDLDAARLRRDFGARRVDVVENGVDPAYFRPEAIRREPDRLLFLGSLDWRPNLDGVRLLLERVLPGGARRPAVGAAVRRRPSAAGVAASGRGGARRRTAGRPARRAAAAGAVRPDGRAAADRRRFAPENPGGTGHERACRFHARRRRGSGSGAGPTPHRRRGRGRSGRGDTRGRAVARPLQEQARRGREAVLRRYGWDALADQLERVWVDCVMGTIAVR